jgi:RND superfamily putative drug exporter
MNVLSLTASFGALVFIFQEGRLEGLLNFKSPGSIELTIPVVMFAVVFGLAMDYELFLLSRVREAYDHTHDTKQSVTTGLEQTGQIITRAALLLVAVMIGFITADMLLVKELGVGMAIAVIVDATIVRGLLVPATMQLMGHFNWWSPRGLARLWSRMHVGVDERGPEELGSNGDRHTEEPPPVPVS